MILWVFVVLDSADDVADLLCIDVVGVVDAGFALVVIQIVRGANKTGGISACYIKVGLIFMDSAYL